MPRLRPFSLVASLGAGALFAAAGAAAVQAQSDELTTGGLRASIDDNPPPALRLREDRRRRGLPGAPRQRAPTFGNPPGSGAGSTGFISTNPPPQRPPRGRTPSGTGPGGAPGVPDTEGPARPGSANTGPLRRGASIEVPAGTATPPIRRQRLPEEDPFEPLGIRAGSFLLRPAIETTAGYDTDPERTSGGRGSAYVTVAPEFHARSDWTRHALNADLRGAYTTYASAHQLDRPFLDARADGRIDITSRTRADLEARTVITTDNPGSPDLPADLAKLPINTTVGGTAGLAHSFNRFEIALKGSVDRVTYANSDLTDGSIVSNADRNYNQYGALLRTAYELTPGMKPFVEATYDDRARDIPVDSFGYARSSHGVSGRAGSTFEFSRKLTGEASIGYLVRTYADPRLADLQGLIADASLIWTANALTAVKVTAKSTADESTQPGVSGVLRRDFGVQVDHAFRRWLIGTARFGYGTDDYEGSPRFDTRYVAALGVIYKLNRSMQLKGEVRQEWLRSTEPNNDYGATVALVGLRLQR